MPFTMKVNRFGCLDEARHLTCAHLNFEFHFAIIEETASIKSKAVHMTEAIPL